jgi:hypothetical protein
MTHMPRLERKNAPEAGLAEIKAAIDGLATTTKQAVTELTERMDELEKKAARPRLGNGDDPKAITPEQARQERKALGTYARTGDETELKAMSVGVDPDGGYTVAPVLSNAMTTKLWDQSPVRRLARMETITVGDAFEEPIDNSESGASWVGEAESRAATTTPTLGYIRVPVQEIYASQKITQRLLDDSRYDLGSWLEGKISDKFGRSEGTAYVSGDRQRRRRDPSVGQTAIRGQRRRERLRHPVEHGEPSRRAQEPVLGTPSSLQSQRHVAHVQRDGRHGRQVQGWPGELYLARRRDSRRSAVAPRPTGRDLRGHAGRWCGQLPDRVR